MLSQTALARVQHESLAFNRIPRKSESDLVDVRNKDLFRSKCLSYYSRKKANSAQPRQKYSMSGERSNKLRTMDGKTY
ncbi:uncharacterized protein N7473_000227 [Penicillium subrubescens]|uniref:uncharacterized protein n=1 Tax=Penicillium subrubescens TaxID=1316194 RepID=UPI002545B111|nr:uncharacterized protein N7473_000227 [Penicillium subrubescens]KAJ5910924.1 hypothetical protein N7473_000227 [Penicillium subrubescens]